MNKDELIHQLNFDLVKKDEEIIELRKVCDLLAYQLNSFAPFQPAARKKQSAEKCRLAGLNKSP